MFLLALLGVKTQCDIERPSCLRCLDHGCGYCWSVGRCMDVNQTDLCKPEDFDTNRTKRCVQTLGRDAKLSVRLGIGFGILIVALIIDITIRVIVRRRSVFEYCLV